MIDATQTENLHGTEAIKKLKALVATESICMFTTNLSQRPLSTRPMATQEVDDDGNFWFFSAKSSDKNLDIANDAAIQLFYSHTTSSEYLSVYGKASVVIDKGKAKQLWTSWAKAWFKEGVDDPELTLIKVEPTHSYFWDTKNNKMVSMLKILASVVTGQSADDSLQGSLKV